MVELCWAPDYEARPEFVDVIEMLEEVAREVSSGVIGVRRLGAGHAVRVHSYAASAAPGHTCSCCHVSLNPYLIAPVRGATRLRQQDRLCCLAPGLPYVG